MAKNDKGNSTRLPSSILNRLRSIRTQMNGIYTDNYSTTPDVRAELDRIGSDAEENISKILTRNNTGNISNLSKLYAIANLRNTVNKSEFNTDIVNFFEDRHITDALINSYMDNKWIAELDREYDIVCKYMPMLVEALNTIKDSVLSADNFDKEYLTFRSLNVGPSENSAFIQQIEEIKRKYELYDRVERWYDNTSKYGEQFVYKVPYSKAYSILLNRKGRTRFGASATFAAGTVRESGTIGNNTITTKTLLLEGSIPNGMQEYTEGTGGVSFFQNQQNYSGPKSINLEICRDSLLQSAVDDYCRADKMMAVAESTSILEAKTDDAVLSNDTFVIDKKRQQDKVAPDGLVSAYTPNNFKVPGLLLKELERKNVILLYIEDICLGYYYLEFMNKAGNVLYTDSLYARSNLTNAGYTAGAKYQDMDTQNSATDDLLKYLSAAIVANLDDKFINNNPQLKKEIYAVLKYNDVQNNADLNTIRVTYLSPQDVEHIKFKEDPDTHRGISDLAAGLISAKMWCCLNIANTIGILTRGQDKRVYYVKQNVEQNIAQTLLNVINQIKKQNFNIMQIENMNSILGITGKYNDYIIPVGPSGEPPIDMQVMQGQDINPQTELLDKLEEITVNSTDVPIELVRARLSVDFATQLTMSNSKFLRFVFKRQAKFEKHIGNIVTDIYNTEYQQNIRVDCVLPAPLMLNVNNLSQILELIQRQAEMLSQIKYFDSNDEGTEAKQKLFIKNYTMYKLGSYIKQNELELIEAQVELEYETTKKSQQSEE